MWIFDEDGIHAGDDPTSYAGYIWVNTSTKYSIESVSDFKYGATGSLTITVNTANDTGCMIAIMGPDNSTIYHKWRATGVTEAIEIDGNFTMAGDYTVKAYRDFDTQNSTYYYPDEYYVAGGITENYSEYYGSSFPEISQHIQVLQMNSIVIRIWVPGIHQRKTLTMSHLR